MTIIEWFKSISFFEKHLLPYLKKWLEKELTRVNLQVKKVKVINQNSTLSVIRIPFYNPTNYTAANVQVEIVEIRDSSKVRQDFLPSTLRWSHSDNEKINIRPKQTRFLDLIDFYASFEREGTPAWFHINKSTGSVLLDYLSGSIFFARLCIMHGRDVENFSLLKPGKSTLVLQTILDNGKSFDFKVAVDWDGRFEINVKIKKNSIRPHEG